MTKCVFAAALLLVAALPHVVAAQPASADAVVAKAVSYVSTFVSRFSRAVAEERYIQDSTSEMRLPSGGVSISMPAQRREWVADFLLVKTDDGSGWTAFRDVFEVNGEAVRDRDDRLMKLFVESPGTAMTRADAITRESSRYNMGARRTINNPLLPLAFLQDSYRSRFTFQIKGQERVDGTETRIVEYRESRRPTLIRTASNGDVPASGRYWVDEGTGRILKAELTANESSAQGSKIVVTYRLDARLQVAVPVQMQEEYNLKDGATVRATARYDRFRQFDVKTNETAR